MGLFSSKRPPSALNPLRDQLVRDLRALARRCAQEHPAEHEYRGILTRVGSLMEGQGPRLDALSEWDLDQRRTDPAALHEGLQVLTGAQHLPRMSTRWGRCWSRRSGTAGSGRSRSRPASS